MVVSLHPFSTGRDAWRERPTGGRRETFETDEKIEIACVLSIENWKLEIGNSCRRGRRGTRRRVKKVKSNSYNEEFDPGSG